jgi:hypothetical protein
MFYSQVKNGGMTIDDYKIVTEFPELIIIISYIRNGKEYHKIFNNYGGGPVKTNGCDKCNDGDIVYAYSYSCGGEENDLTNSFVKYKSSIFKHIIDLNAQHVYNILNGNRYYTKIYCIKYMLDSDCQEKIII